MDAESRALDARVVRLVEGSDGEADGLVVDNIAAGPQDVAYTTDRSGIHLLLPRNGVHTLQKRLPAIDAVYAYIGLACTTVRDAHYALSPHDDHLQASHNMTTWYTVRSKKPRRQAPIDGIREQTFRDVSPEFIPTFQETVPKGAFAIWSESIGLLIVNYWRARPFAQIAKNGHHLPVWMQFLYEQARYSRPLVQVNYQPNQNSVPCRTVDYILAALR